MKNKNRIVPHAIMLLPIANTIAPAQEVTKTSASPISDSVCPNVSTFYEVSKPSGFSICTITWSVANGEITSANGQQTVTIKWKDTPGAKGKVTATFSMLAADSGLSLTFSKLRI